MLAGDKIDETLAEYLHRQNSSFQDPDTEPHKASYAKSLAQVSVLTRSAFDFRNVLHPLTGAVNTSTLSSYSVRTSLCLHMLAEQCGRFLHYSRDCVISIQQFRQI